LGKFISTEEGKFSDQFISSSLDGTIKLWDLQPKPMPAHQKIPTNCRFGYPKKLLSNQSPLSVLNNHLKPSYSVRLNFFHFNNLVSFTISIIGTNKNTNKI